MVSVAILGILMSIAIPTYQNYVLKGRFEEAKATLQAIVLAEERYRAYRGGYYPGNTNVVNEQFLFEMLEVDLSESNNFIYSIQGTNDGSWFVARATLRNAEIDDCTTPANNTSSICKQIDTTDIDDDTGGIDDWVENFDTGTGKHYISYDSRTNQIDESMMFEDGS
jgi:Tfp pilus assembly protein PilE